MTEGEEMVAQMRELVGLFMAKCADRKTLDELARLMADEDRWSDAHALFDRIRAKTVVAIEKGNHRLGVQYAFEEICAKSLYNMSPCDDPFDADAPYFVVPFAIQLARELGIADSRVLAIVTKDDTPSSVLPSFPTKDDPTHPDEPPSAPRYGFPKKQPW